MSSRQDSVGAYERSAADVGVAGVGETDEVWAGGILELAIDDCIDSRPKGCAGSQCLEDPDEACLHFGGEVRSFLGVDEWERSDRGTYIPCVGCEVLVALEFTAV